MVAGKAVPAHAGIIMDGNGRWAKARGLPRTEGHREGLRVAKRIIRAAEDLGIRYLSLYTFSTENWKRAAEEVSFLMSLITRHLRSEFDFYRDNHIRIVHSGDAAGLPEDVREAIRSVMADTSGYDGITVNLAINYGGRDEIVRAARKLLRGGAVDVSEDGFRAFLDAPDLPDPDLVIRTGGDMRLSNFLLWESAYAELYYSEKLWPDWSEGDLIKAVDSYSCRERRYGGTP
ncbi:MAG TPA: polyprenyl diphosphate synthase [Spirochaetia bacterium]|nr:polyprenyl diphosphate synthase [Spirochaetales bacterium]HRY81244.1 polyprenyl diphosphate synthase [Spirochaetia bacterium]